MTRELSSCRVLNIRTSRVSALSHENVIIPHHGIPPAAGDLMEGKAWTRMIVWLLLSPVGRKGHVRTRPHGRRLKNGRRAAASPKMSIRAS